MIILGLDDEGLIQSSGAEEMRTDWCGDDVNVRTSDPAENFYNVLFEPN